MHRPSTHVTPPSSLPYSPPTSLPFLPPSLPSPNLCSFVTQHSPVMLQQELLSLPHLQEQHSPDGHYSRKEYGAWIVKQLVEAHAQTFVLQVGEITLLVTGGAHVERQVV